MTPYYRTKSYWVFAALVAAIALIISMFLSCKATEDPVHNIGYKVSGTANNYDVTLTAPNGNTTQYNGVGESTWTATSSSGNWVYLSAQNNNDQGTVTVTITVDGSVFKTATSTGAYCIAEVDGDIP